VGLFHLLPEGFDVQGHDEQAEGASREVHDVGFTKGKPSILSQA
jgi:hypothetical protein